MSFPAVEAVVHGRDDVAPALILANEYGPGFELAMWRALGSPEARPETQAVAVKNAKNSLPQGRGNHAAHQGPPQTRQGATSRHPPPPPPRLLGIRSRPLMRSALASGSLGPDFGGGARLDRARTLALGHVKTPLHAVGATARGTTQTPRRPNGAGGARGASWSGSASVTTMHALFTREGECKIA